MLNKVSIIGSGDVGAETAFLVAQSQLTKQLVLVDLKADLAQGRALDISHSLGELGNEIEISGGSDYTATQDSDVIVMCAGVASVDGEYSRDKMAATNLKICASVMLELAKYNTEPIIIMVANPVDVLTTWVYKNTNFPKTKIMGFGNILDSSRYAYYSNNSESIVIGEHGDNMVLLGDETPEVKQEVAAGAKAVIDLLKERSTMFGPAIGLTKLIRAISEDTQEVLPVGVMYMGEFGISDVCMGLPCKIGRSGIVSVEAKDIEITDQEQALLQATATKITETLAQ